MIRLALVAALLAACGGKREEPRREAPAPAPVAPTPPAPMAPDEATPVVQAPEVSANPVPEAAPARRLWTDKLEDLATFEAYSTEQGGERFAKFVIDLKSDAIYYFDVDVYKVHKDFVFQEIYKKPKTKEAVRVFDKNYTANKVDFMMCYLVHHIAQDVWTFAFWDGDLATAEHVTHAYKRMRETFVLGDKVKFRPDSAYQEKVATKLVDVPFVLNDTLYKASEYQAFNEGTAVGTLRLVPPNVPEHDLTFTPDEIVVLTTPIADITPVAGIISEQFSTPLSHVSLRARAWGIPNIGLRDARKKHADLDGKPVWFEARGGTYTLRAATPEEVAAKQTQARVYAKVEIPVADVVTKTMAPLDAMRLKDITIYGAKAANLGEIKAAKLPGFEVPPGFGVPFHFYDAHMKANGLDKKLEAMLADPTFQKDAAVRKKQLAAFKQAIIDAPVSDELRAAITTNLATLGDVGVFVRSSGNAEDLEGFNGAGLYDTVPNQRGPDQVLAAIKQVWGSTFNHAAFEDRARAGIDPAKVYSGVLVQVGVAATAAGVLVTRHPTDPTDEKNYTINAKSGLGMAVVDGKKVPESLIVSWYNRGIRILSRSAEDTKLVFDAQGGIREVPNPDKGKPVLTNQMAILLATSAKSLTKVFKNDRLDIEWVFVGDKLFIVQSRPLVGER